MDTRRFHSFFQSLCEQDVAKLFPRILGHEGAGCVQFTLPFKGDHDLHLELNFSQHYANNLSHIFHSYGFKLGPSHITECWTPNGICDPSREACQLRILYCLVWRFMLNMAFFWLTTPKI